MLWSGQAEQKVLNTNIPLKIRDHFTFKVLFCCVSFVCVTGSRLARVKIKSLIDTLKSLLGGHIGIMLAPRSRRLWFDPPTNLHFFSKGYYATHLTHIVISQVFFVYPYQLFTTRVCSIIYST